MSQQIATERKVKPNADRWAAMREADPDNDIGDIQAFVWHLTPLQRENTGMRMVAPLSKWSNDGAFTSILTAEFLGLVNVRRRMPNKDDVEIMWCLTDAGRVYVERFRGVWDRLGVWVSRDDKTTEPMPWPGLPDPYRPGSVEPTF